MHYRPKPIPSVATANPSLTATSSTTATNHHSFHNPLQFNSQTQPISHHLLVQCKPFNSIQTLSNSVTSATSCFFPHSNTTSTFSTLKSRSIHCTQPLQSITNHLIQQHHLIPVSPYHHITHYFHSDHLQSQLRLMTSNSISTLTHSSIVHHSFSILSPAAQSAHG